MIEILSMSRWILSGVLEEPGGGRCWGKDMMRIRRGDRASRIEWVVSPLLVATISILRVR